MILDEKSWRLSRREGYDTEEAASPVRIAFIRFIVRLKGEVPKLVMSGYLCAEGLLGAEDGAAHVCFFDGVSVEDEV